ncbi:MAG: hypothetical protein AAF902_18190, partial [Chloroflexota bacterium]
PSNPDDVINEKEKDLDPIQGKRVFDPETGTYVFIEGVLMGGTAVPVGMAVLAGKLVAVGAGSLVGSGDATSLTGCAQAAKHNKSTKMLPIFLMVFS